MPPRKKTMLKTVSFQHLSLPLVTGKIIMIGKFILMVIGKIIMIGKVILAVIGMNITIGEIFLMVQIQILRQPMRLLLILLFHPSHCAHLQLMMILTGTQRRRSTNKCV